MAEQKSLTTNHELNRVIDSFLATFAKPELVKNLSLLNAEQRASISRGQLFARQLKSQLENSSDAGVVLSALGSVQAGLQNALNELSAFVSNSNPGHVDNYSSHLDGAITQSAPAFFEARTKGDHRYGESIATVEQAAIGAISSIEKQQTDLSRRLDDLANQISNQSQNINAATARLDEKIDEGAASIRGFVEKFDNLSNDQRRELREYLEGQRTEFQTQIDTLKGQGESTIGDLKRLEEQAKSIVQIIGNVGVTGNYQNRAASEENQANIWRWLTLVLFGVGVAMVIVNLVLNFKGSIDVNLLLVRFGIALSIALPAIYTARESARHRSNADRAKQTELELASLGPYLENLTDDDKDKVIIELSKQYFGKEVSEHRVDAPIDVSKLVETVSKIALSKAAPG